MRFKLAATAAVVGIAGFSAAAIAGNGRDFETDLDGFEEVPTVSTAGGGQMEAEINRAGTEIRYVLRYRNLEAPPTQAHIHFGADRTTGGISAWLCESAANPSPSPSTPTCDPAPATIRGSLTEENVVGPAGQGIAAREFAELVRAMRAGVTYANVHTSKFPAGEIRGQLVDDRGHGNDD